MINSQSWQKLVQVKFENKAETSNIDFKKDLSEDLERLKEHINAFGNTTGGGLFVFWNQQRLFDKSR